LKNEMLDRSKISANAVDELQRSQAFHDAVEGLPVEDRKSTRLNSSHRDLPSFPTRRSSDL